MQLRSLKYCVAAAVFTAAGIGSASAVVALPYSDVHVFGDSLSDGGNVYIATGFTVGPDPTDNSFIPSLPYAYGGTFSNGPTWFTPFAAGLGLPGDAAPSLGGGNNHAWGGARMATDGVGLPPSVGTQLGLFLGGGGSFSPGSLVVLAGGGNDVRDVGAAIAGGADPVGATLAGASAYASATADLVDAVKLAGATHIVVWNVPDVGKAPASGSGIGPIAAAASSIAGTFNTFLSGALAGSGATIFDTYGRMNEIISDPAAFGFGNVTDACGAVVNACDASTALFWDGIHPTAHAQAYFAGEMLAVVAIPEPETALLFAFGLAGLLAWSRRRAG